MSASKQQSGVEWIGLVPGHWKITPFKFCYTNSNAGEVIDKSHWHDGNELLYTCQRMPMKSSFSEFPSIKRTTANDLLLTRNGTPYVHLPIENSIYSNVVQRVKLNQEINREFAGYMLGSAAKQLRGFGDIIESFNMGTWNETIFLLPPQNEQLNLVKFIDNKTTLIDNKISNLEKSILLLEEKRSALITNAVTKGLNLDVPMKEIDSPWIDSIPEDWTNLRIKQIVNTKVTDGPHVTPVQVDEGVPFLSATAVENGRLNMNKMWGYISREDHELYCRKCLPQLEDIFMVKSGATTGSIAFVDFEDEFSVWSPLALIRCDRKKMHPRFVFYSLQSDYLQKAISQTWSKGTQENIAMKAIEELPIIMPPLHEQIEIANYIDVSTNLFNGIISKINSIIEKLKEYQTALISAAVTGKIDVRGQA
jgi:type I restriction enzyme, S subunit